MARRKPRPNPYTSQAEADALVRFGPERSTLVQLLADAEAKRDADLQQARVGRQRTVGAVDQALPQIANDYAGAAQQINPNFAQQGGTEAQALQARMAEALAQAQGQLRARSVGAVQGEGAARTQALRDFSTDRGKIAGRATDLSREVGAFITSQTGDYAAAAAKAKQDQADLDARLGQSERSSIRSAGLDPDQPLPGGGYAPIPGSKADPKAKPGKPNKGRGWATLDQQGQAADALTAAIASAKSLKEHDRYKRHEAAADLLAGVPDNEIKLYDPATGKPQVWQKDEVGPNGENKKNDLVGQQKSTKIPGIPQVKSQLLLSAALDIVYDGHLSRKNQKLLQARGIKIGPLGVTTFQEWLKTPEGQEWRNRQRKIPRSAPGQAVPGIGNALG